MSLLRKAMRMLDIKHRDLAMRMGVSPSYLSRLFHGVIDLKLDQLVRMVDALGLRPGEFFRMAYPDTAEPPSSAAVALRGLMPAMPLMPSIPSTSSRTEARAVAATPATAPIVAPASPTGAATGVYVTAEEVERQVEETVRRLFSELGRGTASPS